MELFFHNYPQLICLKKSKLKLFFLKTNKVPLIIHKNRSPLPPPPPSSKHTTIHPILHLLNHCAEANNKPNSEYILVVFCDLSKAFDVIYHTIPCHKLRAYGLGGIVNTWFKNYLKTDRTQFVEIENQRSPLKHLLCGVSQGSILGPLFYLIYCIGSLT